MKSLTFALKSAVAAILLTGAALSQDNDIEQLFETLKQDELPNWEQVEQQIWQHWSRSGSDVMDLLLQRGRKAMEEGKHDEAIAHFSALVDHAPDFAEGWNARATAFFASDRYGMSISDIQQTLSLNPRHFGALQGLGRILEELGEDEAALDAYETAYSIHPHRPNLKEAIDRLRAKTQGRDT